MTVEQIANDFGVHPMTLFTWLRRADAHKGIKVAVTCRVLDIARQPYYRWHAPAGHQTPN
ncbi:hypothetical protein [Kibdelosporangium phytohabitans]|uniref:hypothetical protein n=1 Tax=Kibdelosporangium phytohabitans TaxID=860235 RepID=UPI0012F8D68E|nr:hypothetical protein [Kibdelosporangium phytohabitans]MBE1470284.1 transposase-like protein [Kibdelosporangium phytohabitans]